MKYIAVALLVILVAGGVFFVSKFRKIASGPAPTPTVEPLVQLPADKHPNIKLEFSADAHYVTVNIDNLHATALEYNLIYEATVKKTKLQTGVNASESLDGKTTYSKRQLLGSESSGKFTYHADIKNAVMELTLRDTSGRSIFTSAYPFAVSPGKSINLEANL